MSPNRKKIIEPWEIVRETCGSPTKIAMFACFAHPKNLFFHLFFKISRFQPKFKTKIRPLNLGQQTRYFAPNAFPTDEGRVPLKEDDGRTKKNNVLFCSCDDVIGPNGIKLRPFAPLCDVLLWLNDFLNRFIRFQRYCLKTVSSAHRPTL